MNKPFANDTVVKTWIDRASLRKSTICFCVDVSHVIAITNRFRKYGIDARFVVADTPTASRNETVQAFLEGQFSVLVNCGGS